MSKLTNFSLALLLLMLLFCCKTFAAEYTVPRAAYSVYAEDLDLDGDRDIVVGHNYNPQTQWSGVSILENNGYGEFTLIDSIFLYGWQPDVQIKNLNLNENPEIIAKRENATEENEYIAIIKDFHLCDISYFSLNTYEGVANITTGDIDNDNDMDIIVACNGNQTWGVLYNDGTGQFSEPDYYSVAGVSPTDIECGNLNSDKREDILVSGLEVRIYYSYPTGFDCYIINEEPEMQVEIGDLDNDGDNDIVGISDIFDIIALTKYENIGDTAFYEHNQELYEIYAPYFTLSDLNNNNLPDVVCSGTYGVYVLYNEGDFQLSEPQYFPTNTSGICRPPFCVDVDGNGYNDIITIRGLYSTGILTILFNDGNGNFVEEPQVAIDPHSPPLSEVSLSPNPFTVSTNISFITKIPLKKEAKIKIYNAKGELVRKLDCHQNGFTENGKMIYTSEWDGKNRNNKRVSSGIYFSKIKLNKKEIVNRMLFMN